MIETLQRIVSLVGDKKLRVSAHALERLVDNGILIEPLIDGIAGLYWSRITRTTSKDRRYLSCSSTSIDYPSIWSGASRQGRLSQQCW